MASRPNPADSTGVPGGALIAFGIAMLGLAIALVAAMTGMGAMKSREAALRKQVDSLTVALNHVRGEAGALGDELRTQIEGLEEWELAELRGAGLASPIADLKADLRAHPELIPFKGELGGTMGIHTDESVQILGPRWVLADFDDGHQSGSMLLEFSVAGGKIRWKRLAARLD